MRNGYWYFILFLLIMLSIFGDSIGFATANWGDPITSNDLLLMVAAIIAIVIIEIHDAANYIVKKLKNPDE